MTSPAAPTHILWLDLETTGSSVVDDHVILEIGAIITRHTPDLPEVARASMVVRPDGDQQQHALLWGRMNPYVQQMHTQNGLWEEAVNGDQAWGIVEADGAFARWVTDTVEADNGELPLPLAGSGVAHLDRPFVMRHMPATATRLTYWLLDVGIQRRLFQLAGRDDQVHLEVDVEAKPHRGLGDVELHVAEARRYLQALNPQRSQTEAGAGTGELAVPASPPSVS